MIGEADGAVSEDDAYTYDYTLKGSRASAIPKLLAKYSFPLKIGLGREGITTRGAPGLRLFRAIRGGGVIAHRPKAERALLLNEAVELVRLEMLRVVGQAPVEIPSHCFDDIGTFVQSLLDAVQNRSNGRVEQALVGAKLQLRFPDSIIPNNPSFAADRQTRRDCDFEVDDIRVIVSVAPKDQHFESAVSLVQAGRTVYFIVAEKHCDTAKKRLRRMSPTKTVVVHDVNQYVTSNMGEIARDRKLSPRQMCMLLVAEYNRRIAADNDPSLQVVEPA
ncbi:MAG: DUF4928 family protein [Thermoguttaceae bacterium]